MQVNMSQEKQETRLQSENLTLKKWKVILKDFIGTIETNIFVLFGCDKTDAARVGLAALRRNHKHGGYVH